MKKFMVIAAPRSGSTWFIEMLDSHPDICCYEELFLVKKFSLVRGQHQDKIPWHRYWLQQQKLGKAILKPYFLFRYLSQIYNGIDRDINAIGFKLIYSQFYHHPEIFFYLILYQIRLIHLVRQNVLDVILSREAAKIRGISHSYHRVETVQVHLDPVTLIKQLKTHEAKTAYFRRMISLMGISCLEIHYEDLLADQSSYHQVLDFLGISGQPGLSSSLQKLNPISHQMVIENYHVIQRLLAETPYRRFLH